MAVADGGHEGIVPTDGHALVACCRAHLHVAMQPHEHGAGLSALLRRGHGRAVNRALALDILPGQGAHIAAHAAGQLLALPDLRRKSV
ncbi:hypothetical protein SDC9_168958 [bioreactor metagenome]|uniref:Uncharacterized protein n=1 Tax=bioreactor metagenome TaxID=1076179 RepID=A0A645G3Z1_9ZZZZ